jgi:hypothetical protein
VSFAGLDRHAARRIRGCLALRDPDGMTRKHCRADPVDRYEGSSLPHITSHAVLNARNSGSSYCSFLKRRPPSGQSVPGNTAFDRLVCAADADAATSAERVVIQRGPSQFRPVDAESCAFCESAEMERLITALRVVVAALAPSAVKARPS